MMKNKVDIEELRKEFNSELCLVEKELENFIGFFSQKDYKPEQESSNWIRENITSALSDSIQTFRNIFHQWVSLVIATGDIDSIDKTSQDTLIELNSKIMAEYINLQSLRSDMNSNLEKSLESHLKLGK